MFFLVIGIMAVIAILFTRRYLKDRDKTAIALSNGDSYKALIVSVGDKIVQYGKQYRTLNVVADMDGRTECVRSTSIMCRMICAIHSIRWARRSP